MLAEFALGTATIRPAESRAAEFYLDLCCSTEALTWLFETTKIILHRTLGLLGDLLGSLRRCK
jgi:hypothetical protein